MDPSAIMECSCLFIILTGEGSTNICQKQAHFFWLLFLWIIFFHPPRVSVELKLVTYGQAEYSWVMFYFNPPFQLEHFQLLSPWLITDKSIVLFSVYLVLPHVL